MSGNDPTPSHGHAHARPGHHREIDVNSASQDVRPPHHGWDGGEDHDVRQTFLRAGFNFYSEKGREQIFQFLLRALDRDEKATRLLAFRQKTLMGILALTGAAMFAIAGNIILRLLPESIGKWLMPP